MDSFNKLLYCLSPPFGSRGLIPKKRLQHNSPHIKNAQTHCKTKDLSGFGGADNIKSEQNKVNYIFVNNIFGIVVWR